MIDYVNYCSICVRNCPLQSFTDHSTDTCHMCDSPCLRCTGSDVTNSCLSCVPGYLLVQGEGHCVRECPSGFYDYEGKHCTLFSTVYLSRNPPFLINQNLYLDVKYYVRSVIFHVFSVSLSIYSVFRSKTG